MRKGKYGTLMRNNQRDFRNEHLSPDAKYLYFLFYVIFIVFLNKP